MIINLLVEGGAMAPGPALAQKLGPMGINMGKVISEINKATSGFKGIKVPVDLNVDPATKEFTIIVKSPPVSELIKKEMKIEKGSGDHKNLQAGNIAIEQIILIAKTKLPDMLEKDLKAAVRSVIGTCVSLGVLIENKPAKEIEQEITDGKYDKEIKSEKSEVSPEKKKELDLFFAALRKKQEAKIKEAEEAKAAEAKPEEAKPEEAKAAEAKTPAKAGAKAEPKKAEAKKPEAKKSGDAKKK
ncbi:MAG: 50S ribosomal protein L11 [Candidatus Pacearchaeota archaeon]